MLIVNVHRWESRESSKAKTICQLAWDDQLKKIVILKGKRIGKRILKGRYLDKRDYPKRLKYIEAKQGKAFIRDLSYSLDGSRIWASVAREEAE